MRTLIIILAFFSLESGFCQSGSSLFLGHSLSYQQIFDTEERNGESLNSTGLLGVHLKNDVVLGVAFSLNALIGVPFNEVGFAGGYSNDNVLALLAVKSYQSTFAGSDFGVQSVFGYTWEFQKNLAIGPSLSAGVLFLDQTQWSIGVGILIKQLKPE